MHAWLYGPLADGYHVLMGVGRRLSHVIPPAASWFYPRGSCGV